MRTKRKDFAQPGSRNIRTCSQTVACTFTLALVLAGATLCTLSQSPHSAYALSDCGILILCPSPTPGPSPTPTPIPTPSPRPTPKPTPTPSLTPTPTSPPITGTPTPAPVASPGPLSQPVPQARHLPSPAGRNESSTFLVLIVSIFFCLLIALGVGLLAFRRMLLPQIDVKLPPSGARPWSRFRVPNPRSLAADSETQIIRETPQAVAVHTQTGTFSSANQPVLASGAGADTQQELFSVPSAHKPGFFDSGAFLESILSASPSRQPAEDNETSASDRSLFP
jgi:nitrate reductase NapE component